MIHIEMPLVYDNWICKSKFKRPEFEKQIDELEKFCCLKICIFLIMCKSI